MAPLRRFQEFVLSILPDGLGYQARVLASPAGQAVVGFAPPFLAHEMEVVDSSRWSNMQTVGGMTPQTVGERLFAAAFAEGVAEALHRSLDRLAPDEGLRIVLRLTEAPEFASLPWEFLYDAQLERFLGLDPRTPVVRYLDIPVPEPLMLQVSPPLRVLVILSNPADSPARLQVEEEWASLEGSLAGLQKQEIVELVRLKSATLGALRHQLQTEQYHILHYVGHGAFDKQSQSGGLLFENAEGLGHLVLADELKVVLHNHSSLRLVFLNACHGAISSLYNPFTGVAQSLVLQEMPAVIAMQGQISDEAAQLLAEEFYTALAHNYATDAALTEARVALYTQASLEWATPVLYSRSKDNHLFRVVLPAPPCPYPGMAPFAPDQQRYFFGRDKEIRDGVARLRFSPFLMVIGASGSGKSSLVNVGLLPALRQIAERNGEEVDILSMRPGLTPQQRLADLFGLQVADLPGITSKTPVILVIDQFEEVFTQASESVRTDFLALLADLIGRDTLRIVTTVRADFYPALMASPLWPQIQGNRLELTPLDRNGLREVIVQPSATLEVTVEDGLVERLIGDAAGDAGALPFLQETLVQMWGEMNDRTLTLAAYDLLGTKGRTGLQNAIARRANITYGSLSASEQIVARRIFLRLIQFGEGKDDFRRQAAVTELTIRDEDCDLFNRVLQLLAGDRLLTLSVDEQRGEQLADISHESLLNGWPALVDWRADRKEAETLRRRFEARAHAYAQRNYTGGRLDEVELLEVERWLAGIDAQEVGGASDALNRLVEESRRAIKEARQRDEASRRRELELERSRRRRSQALVAVLGAMLLFFVGQSARNEYLRWRASSNGTLPTIRGDSVQMEPLEVTNQRYRLCVQTGRCTEPVRRFSTYFEADREDYPVTGVSGLQAARFCQWLGRRLPSRNEWLMAATNGDLTPYPWGTEDPTSERANLLYDGDSRLPEKAGGRSLGENRTGMEDLVGNVFEWTSTCFAEGKGGCDSDNEWNGQPERIPERLYVMGGSFLTGISGLQSLENNAQSELVREFIGFRCAE